MFSRRKRSSQKKQPQVPKPEKGKVHLFIKRGIACGIQGDEEKVYPPEGFKGTPHSQQCSACRAIYKKMS